jgi:hypothetical protein
MLEVILISKVKVMNLFEFNKQYVHSRCKIWPGFYTAQIARIIDPNYGVLIFGDNCNQTGKGGQAIIRDAKCAFGIVTKRRPSCESHAYFSDTSLADRTALLADINALHLKLQANPLLVAYFPEHGPGTGLSEMPTRCPNLFKEMNDVIKERFGIDYTNYTQE